MKNILSRKWVLYGAMPIVLVLIGIQFIHPSIERRPVTGDLSAPADVKALFRRACYDCHSNETKLAWYDHIAPGRWLVAKHIREGRKALNFSEWDRLTSTRRRSVMFEAFNHIQFKAMPLHQYLLLHPGAKIAASDIQLLSGYLDSLMVRPAEDDVKQRLRRQQFKDWAAVSPMRRTMAASPNGLLFNNEYNDWIALSTTVRDDNGTLKMILGNNIAAQAAKNGRTNPWPDGATLAKVTWAQIPGTDGITGAGEFKQVAFMTKDAHRSRSTGGWGFSQWDDGIAFTPHGKDAFFATECVNCHRPMRDNDLVFTMPADIGMLPEPGNKVIALSVDERSHTLSTLYGNDIAVRYTRASTELEPVYPPGSILTMITWSQKADEHWYGARIPGRVKFVEKVTIPDTGVAGQEFLYEKYEGVSLKKVETDCPDTARSRIRFIISRPVALLPAPRNASN